MELQKPIRDERSRVIGMAEVGFNINYDVFHFDVHNTIAYRIINRFVKKSWLETARDRADRTKTYSTGGTFHSDHFYSKPALNNI